MANKANGYQLKSIPHWRRILCRRLTMKQGGVSSRVALLLRSAEAKLLFNRFVHLMMNVFFFFYLLCTSGEARSAWAGEGLEAVSLGCPSLPAWACSGWLLPLCFASGFLSLLALLCLLVFSFLCNHYSSFAVSNACCKIRIQSSLPPWCTTDPGLTQLPNF